MTAILERIKAYKLEEIAAARAAVPENRLAAAAASAGPTRGFARRLRETSGTGFALIGEIKRASPSRGVIREHFAPGELARAYEAGGACCLSVLTDRPSFQGAPEFLTAARGACALPVLRKDFMYDPYQVLEARAWGADCILVIMASVSDSQARELEAAARSCGMDALLEVHDETELDRALLLGSELVGINNRDLRTFDVTLETTRSLAPRVPDGRTIVSESGISGHVDFLDLAGYGVRSFLVGESIMREADVTSAVRRLLSGVGGGRRRQGGKV